MAGDAWLTCQQQGREIALSQADSDQGGGFVLALRAERLSARNGRHGAKAPTFRIRKEITPCQIV
jgi:hypothetical protein